MEDTQEPTINADLHCHSTVSDGQFAPAEFAARAHANGVTLWSLTDESSPRLMVPFYAGLAAGESPAHALRAAKLAMLRDPRFLHPHHWAPFVLVGGDPR